jgi:serine/threonine protein kinase
MSTVIGEGAFGCVIKPSLPCSNKKISYKNKISKVMFSKEAVKELKEYAIIAKADKSQKFYLGVPTHCRVKKTKETIKAIEKCIHLKKKYFHKKSIKEGIKQLDLLVMEDGGMNLKMLSIMIDVMRVTRENSIKVKKIWLEMHKLFRGILLFQKHGIVHHDIKPQNIVYNLDDNNANFIDFGHMRKISFEIKKIIASDNWIYDYPFWNYPFEIQFLNKSDYVKFSSKTVGEKERVFSILLDDIHNSSNTKFVEAFRIFLDYIIYNKNNSEEKKIIRKYLLAYHKTIVDQILPDRYEEFLHKSVKSIDVYGLGMSLYYLLNCSTKFLKKEMIDALETCFFNMTTPNLLQRLSIEEAIDMYENILTEYGFMDEFELVFKNHEIVDREGNVTSLKKIHSIDHSNVSIHSMSKHHLEKAMKMPECSNRSTRKCNNLNSHNTTRRVYK